MKSRITRVSNPPQRFSKHELEWLEEVPSVAVEVFEERAKSIISSNKSPDLGFSYSINPYRGCFHACAYCYARPSHQYIDFGAGTDFDRKLVAKINAPELLKQAFDKASWRGELLVFSGVTDCYQPLELSYRLTRRCLEVCRNYRNPVSIITKSAIIARDVELLKELQAVSAVQVTFSVASFDQKKARALEPHAASPQTRLRAMRVLADAGIPVGVALSPIIPAWNDSDIPETLRQAAEAGARSAWMTLLRLPSEVEEVFVSRLSAVEPVRSKKILAAVRDMRAGALSSSRFGERMQGEGSRWQAIEWLFESACRNVGLHRGRDEFVGEMGHAAATQTSFQRPYGQLALFQEE